MAMAPSTGNRLKTMRDRPLQILPPDPEVQKLSDTR